MVSGHLRGGLALDRPAIDPAADTYRAYARIRLNSTDEQFDCLDNLWSNESGWRPTAQNPGSTAYGIAQLLDQTWALMETDKTSDPYGQIDVGLRYIDKRYGTRATPGTSGRTTTGIEPWSPVREAGRGAPPSGAGGRPAPRARRWDGRRRAHGGMPRRRGRPAGSM